MFETIITFITAVVAAIITAIVGPLILQYYKKKQEMPEPPKPQKASIRKLWVEHNARDESGKAGMKIHLGFTTGYLKGVPCRASAYFCFANGKELRDSNLEYHSYDGQVSTGTTFTPNFVLNTFKDVVLFMPYEELHIASGRHELKFHVNLRVISTGFIVAKSADHTFVFNAASLTSISKPTWKINDVWLESGITKKGEAGFNIHVKFSANNLKGIDCRAVAYFRFPNGKKLVDRNNRYHTVEGNVSASTSFTPRYDNSSYKDLIIFMPSEELHLRSGTHTIECYVQLYDKPTTTRSSKSRTLSLKIKR